MSNKQTLKVAISTGDTFNTSTPNPVEKNTNTKKKIVKQIRHKVSCEHNNEITTFDNNNNGILYNFVAKIIK